MLKLLVLSLAIMSCNGQSTSSTTAKKTPSTPKSFTGTTYSSVGTWTSNTMAISVNGTKCGSNASAYANFPCVEVIICSIADPTICATVNNILLDTGSYGLRVFRSAIQAANASVTSGLVPVTNGSSALGECITYGDSSSTWGSVEYAYVQLAGEPKVGIPIQVIDVNFNTPPSICDSTNSYQSVSPSQSGFNGILGVGYLAQDCGTACANASTTGQYYTCTDGDCTGGAQVDLNAQVINPVAALPVDNNGVVITLPTLASSGAVSVEASAALTIGIGTHGNVSGTPKVLVTDDYGDFWTNSGSSYNSTTKVPGFIDSGSNYYFFTSSMPSCSSSSPASGLFCPTSDTALTYTNTSYTDHSVTAAATFTIVNADTVVKAHPTYNVFPNFGENIPTTLSGMFDFGLPFFFGRTIYFGIKGTTSSLGAGPFYAY